MPKFEADQQRDEVDLFVIGDSITKYIKPDLINPGGKNVLKCVSGGKVEHIRKEIIDMNKKSKVNKMILSVGTNHIPAQHPHDIATAILGLVKEIKKEMPSTTLIVNSILPKYGKQDRSFLPGIMRINNELRAATKELGFRLIYNSQFVNDEGFTDDSLLSSDGVHLSFRGVVQLGRNFKFNFYKI